MPGSMITNAHEIALIVSKVIVSYCELSQLFSIIMYKSFKIEWDLCTICISHLTWAISALVNQTFCVKYKSHMRNDELQNFQSNGNQKIANLARLSHSCLIYLQKDNNKKYAQF